MNIKNFALTGLLFSSVVIANAQQKLSDGIGDNGLTVNQNAILELASKNKGLLHTRVTLETTAKAYPMSAHVAGLMVYNTETRNDVVPGIYYNDGSKWVLASGGKATSISYNPTTFEISFVDASGNPVTIDFKEVVKKNETITTLVSLGEGKYEYNSENGTKTLINVPAAVIQNFETIVKDENVKNEIINLIKNIGGNVYYDGAKFTYITPQGEVKEITIKEIVQANETETTLTKNANGTYTYKNEKGIEVIIDIPASVVENFEQIVKKGPVTINGNTFDNIEQYIQYIASSSVALGGSDFVSVSGKGRSADPYKVEIKGGDTNTMLVTNAAGELQWATIESIVKGNETITTLVSLGEGKYEYTAEDGKKTVINVPSDVIQNFETIVKDESVKNEIVNLIKNVGGNVYYDGDKFTYVTTTGETKEITIKEIVQANETLTVMNYDAAKNVLKYKDEKGKEEVINLNIGTVVYDSGTNTITYVDGNKKSTPLVLNETSLVYDDKTKVLTYTDSRGKANAIDLGALVAAHETVTTLVKNGDGTYTYTNEKKATTIIDIPAEVINNFEQIVKEEVKVDGRTFNTVEEYITYLTESKGGFTKIVYDQTTGDVIFQEWDASTNKWVNVDNTKFETIVKSNETLTVLGYDQASNTLTYQDEKGDKHPLALGTGSVVYTKEDNTITYTDAKGVPTVLTLNATSLVYNETTKVLTYTNSKGEDQSIDLETLVAGNTTNELTLVGTLLTSTVNGKVSAVTLTDANLTSDKKIIGTGITVGGGEGSTLKDVTLAITPGTKDGQLLITEGNVTKWVDQSTIVPKTLNELTKKKDSNGNTLVSNVNGIESEATIIETVGNAIIDGKLVTTVNGKTGNALDLTTIIQADQKITEVVDGINTTVIATPDGNKTKYAVNVSNAAIQDAQQTTVVSAGKGVAVVSETNGKETKYTVSADPTNITLNGDVTGNAGETSISKIQGKELVAKTPAEGNVLVFEGDKWVTKTPTVDAGNVIGGKSLTSTDLDLTPNASTSLLKDVTANIKTGAVTSDKIKDGDVKTVDIADKNITKEKIAPGTANQVLVTNSDGSAVNWVNQSTLMDNTTANNGLTKAVNNIKLGGELSEKTTITTTSANTLAIAGLQKGDVKTDSYVVMDASSGVLKQLKAAMPKFFYMPSVEILTHNTGTGAVLKNQTIELYTLYTQQYGGTYAGNATTAAGQARSNGSSQLPTLPVGELDYFVTYFDQAVFENVTVNANGQLKYSVKNDAIVTPKTFMNIVFKVKD